MLRVLIRKEILLHLREARFIWVAGLFCGLLILGFVLTARDLHRRQITYQASVAAERRHILDIDESASLRNQVRTLVNDRGVYAFRPPRALGPLALGLEPATPTQIHVSDRQSWARQASEAFYSNPLLSLFPRPDFATLVASILSLAALFFTFDALCGEKQTGTLKLALSAGIGRHSILIGKWGGAILTLGAPFLLATSAGVLILNQVGGLPLGANILLRTAGIVGFALLYLSLFISLGLLVSTLVGRPSSALLVCLTLWVGATFVLPHLLASAGEQIAPAPTFQQIRLQKRSLDLQRQARVARLASLVETGQITEEDRQKQQESLLQDTETQKQRIDRDYLRRVDRQTGISRALSRLSPSAGFICAASELADTGLGFYREAHTAFQRYRREFTDYARRLKQEEAEGRLGANWLHTEDIPGLHLSGLRGGFGTVANDLLILLLYHAAAFGVAYARFRYYDVR